MQISGIFWTSEELQKLLGVSKQQIVNLASRYHWESPAPGLYRGGVAEDSTTVDAYLFARNRKAIKGSRALDWDDSYDLDCPECNCFALAWPDDTHYKCVNGHSGQNPHTAT